MPTKSNEAAAAKQDVAFLRQRLALNDAHAALQGRSTSDTFAAFTLEEAADAQIELIEGEGTKTHPSKLERVERTRGALTQAIAALRNVSPGVFVAPTEAANTPSDDDELWGSDASIP